MLANITHYSMVHKETVIDHLTIPEKFFLWIHEHITEPIEGFEHKQNPNGTPYSKQQQVSATRRQAIAIVHDFLRRGKSEPEIFEMLYLFK